MPVLTPPINGIARKRRSDIGVPRKSNLDAFCDLFRRMSGSEQSTALEVLRQIQRLRLPAEQISQEEPKGATDNG